MREELAEEDVRLAAIHDVNAPGSLQCAQARFRLRDHAAVDRAVGDELADLRIGERREQRTAGVEDAGHGTQLEKLRGPKSARQISSGIVCIEGVDRSCLS